MSTMATLFFDISTARACANIPITDNNVTEPPEDICVVLTPEDGDPADPTNSKTTVTIIDDDMVTIGFEREVYEVTEDEGTVEVCALIREGALNREVTISLFTRDSSATVPDDYSAVSTILSFDGDRTRQCVDITILRDGIVENLEDFEVLLVSVDSVPVILSPDISVVMITDSDGESEYPL